MAAVLTARDIDMRFGGITALSEVDFALEDGDIHCVIGPNGAGKSTFFKVITGQLKPTRGRVHVGAHEVTGLPCYRIARRGIGIKTQVPQLFDGLSVEENIWLAARRNLPGREVGAAVESALDEVGIAAHAKVVVGQMAHGLRQWVEIAMVLAGRPRIVLLDEPAAGMSDEEVDRMAALLRRIGSSRTMIVVEHDMRFIRQIASRVTVFHRGRIFIEGSADAVLADQGVRDIYLGRSAERRNA